MTTFQEFVANDPITSLWSGQEQENLASKLKNPDQLVQFLNNHPIVAQWAPDEKQQLFDELQHDLNPEVSTAAKEAPGYLDVIKRIPQRAIGMGIETAGTAARYLSKYTGLGNPETGKNLETLGRLMSQPLPGRTLGQEVISDIGANALYQAPAIALGIGAASKGLGLAAEGAPELANLYFKASKAIPLAFAGTTATIQEFGKAQESGYSPLQSAAVALPIGAAEVIFEKFALDKLLDFGGKGAIKKGIDVLLREFPSEFGTQLTDNAIESIADAVTGHVENGLYPKYEQNPDGSIRRFETDGPGHRKGQPIPYTLWSALKEATHAGVVGAGAGFALGTTVGAVETPLAKKALAVTDKQLKDFHAQLTNPPADVTPGELNQLTKTFENQVEERNKQAANLGLPPISLSTQTKESTLPRNTPQGQHTVHPVNSGYTIIGPNGEATGFFSTNKTTAETRAQELSSPTSSDNQTVTPKDVSIPPPTIQVQDLSGLENVIQRVENPRPTDTSTMLDPKADRVSEMSGWLTSLPLPQTTDITQLSHKITEGLDTVGISRTFQNLSNMDVETVQVLTELDQLEYLTKVQHALTQLQMTDPQGVVDYALEGVVPEKPATTGDVRLDKELGLNSVNETVPIPEEVSQPPSDKGNPQVETAPDWERTSDVDVDALLGDLVQDPEVASLNNNKETRGVFRLAIRAYHAGTNFFAWAKRAVVKFGAKVKSILKEAWRVAGKVSSSRRGAITIGTPGPLQTVNPTDRIITNPEVDTVHWVSPTADVIERKMPNSAPVEQVRQILRQGKSEEIADAELDMWLSKQEGKVSKEEVLNALKRGTLSIWEYKIPENQRNDEYELYTLRATPENNYREYLFVLPTRQNETRELHREGHFFESTGIPDVMAHLRATDRFTLDNSSEKLFHIEELQTDWITDGKVLGFKGDPQYIILDENGSRITDAEFQLATPHDNRRFGYAPNERVAKQYVNRLKQFTGNNYSYKEVKPGDLAYDKSLPLAKPTHTKTWLPYFLKRIIRMATEQGYTGVSWTPGHAHQKYYSTIPPNLMALIYQKKSHEKAFNQPLYGLSFIYPERGGKRTVARIANSYIPWLDEILDKSTVEKIQQDKGREFTKDDFEVDAEETSGDSRNTVLTFKAFPDFRNDISQKKMSYKIPNKNVEQAKQSLAVILNTQGFRILQGPIKYVGTDHLTRQYDQRMPQELRKILKKTGTKILEKQIKTGKTGDQITAVLSVPLTDEVKSLKLPLYSVEYLIAKYTAKGLNAAFNAARSFVNSGIDFTQYVAEMIKQFSEKIRPVLSQLWSDANNVLRSMGRSGVALTPRGRPQQPPVTTRVVNVTDAEGRKQQVEIEYPPVASQVFTESELDLAKRDFGGLKQQQQSEGRLDQYGRTAEFLRDIADSGTLTQVLNTLDATSKKLKFKRGGVSQDQLDFLQTLPGELGIKEGTRLSHKQTEAIAERGVESPLSIASKFAPGGRALSLFDQARLDQGIVNAVELLRAIRAKDKLQPGNPATQASLEYVNAIVNALGSARLGNNAEHARALRYMQRLGKESRNKARLAEVLSDTRVALSQAKTDALLALDPKSDNFIPSVERIVGVTSFDKFFEYFLFNILSGLKTHARNFSSNTVSLAGQPLEATVAAAVDGIRGKQKQTGRSFKDAITFMFAWHKATRDAFRLLSKVLISGDISTITYDNPALAKIFSSPESVAFFKGEGTTKAIEGKLGTGLRTVFSALRAMDVFFRALASFGQLNVDAERAARRAGLSPTKTPQKYVAFMSERLSNPSPEAVKAAADAGLYRTFQLPLRDKASKLFMQLRASKTLAGRVSRLLVPFYVTPANIFKQGFERSPLGFASVWSKINKSVKDGGISEQEFADEIAKPIVGTGLMGIAAYLVLNGMMTGAGPKDRKKREALYSSGWRPHSLVFKKPSTGQKVYLGFSALEPLLGTNMALMADGIEAVLRASKEDKNDNVVYAGLKATLSAVANTAKNKLFLQGFWKAVDAVSDPERYMDRYLQNWGRAVSPGSGLAKSIVDFNAAERYRIDSFSDAFLYNFPTMGAMKWLPQLDWLGRVKVNTPQTSGIARALAPISYSEESTDPADILTNKLGIDAIAPNKTVLNGKKILSPEMHNEYIQMAGKQTLKYLRKMARVILPRFNRLTPRQREIYTKRINQHIRSIRSASIKRLMIQWKRSGKLRR